MEKNLVDCKFYFEDLHTNRKILFREALNNAKNGKVLYIMHDELEELPELSQELSASNRHYMKMISFLYANSLGTLLESLSTLPEWQLVPTTIILDDLSTYCNKTSLHAACGIVALLLDSIRSCSTLLNKACVLYISVTNDNVDEDFCNVLRELYFSF